MMQAPQLAPEVWPVGDHNFFAVACQSDCPYNFEQGWSIRYREAPGFADSHEAVINLYVQDLSSPFLGILPFVIDTGSDVTIIPRRLLNGPGAFHPSKTLGQYQVEGLVGGAVVGLRFRATVAIVPLQPDLEPICFNELKPIVINDWAGNYGVLGMDALRQVVMVSDGDYVSLWPRSTTQCFQRRV
jgi:hypothetical protein